MISIIFLFIQINYIIFVLLTGLWTVEEPKRSVESGNLGLVLKSKARHAAISTPLSKPFIFKDKPLVVQYEVIFQEGQECGGAYLKLLSVDSQHKDLRNFHDKTPYTIMFGPDKCGNDHKVCFLYFSIKILTAKIIHVKIFIRSCSCTSSLGIRIL